MKGKGILKEIKNREHETRKNLIIDAAERVFAVKPFDKVSMSEIAREVGMATSSLYTYFPNQEALFIEAALRDANSLIDEMAASVSKQKKPRIETVVNAFIDYFSRNDSYFRMMAHFMLYGTLRQDSIEKINSITRRMMDLFDTIFTRAGISSEPRLISHSFFAALNGLLISFRKYPGRTDKEIIAHMKRIGAILAKYFSTKP